MHPARTGSARARKRSPALRSFERDFQNVARLRTRHRLEAYATLACPRGCRWFADVLAGAFLRHRLTLRKVSVA
jgi:hypothetical protein